MSAVKLRANPTEPVALGGTVENGALNNLQLDDNINRLNADKVEYTELDTPPSTNTDSVNGYSKGDLVKNTVTNKFYICVDNANGNAVWVYLPAGADAITAAEIAPGTITANEIATDTITAAEIATDAIGTAEIAPNAVTANEIAPNAVTANEIAPNAVNTAAIVDGAVTIAKLAGSLNPVVYKGVFNTPANGFPAGNKGDLYIVTVAGTYYGVVLQVNDQVICNADGTTANTTVNWDIGQGNINLATTTEAINGIDGAKYISPTGLKAGIENMSATMAAKILTSPTLNGNISGTAIEGTVTSSTAKVPTSKAVQDYSDYPGRVLQEYIYMDPSVVQTSLIVPWSNASPDVSSGLTFISTSSFYPKKATSKLLIALELHGTCSAPLRMVAKLQMYDGTNYVNIAFGAQYVSTANEDNILVLKAYVSASNTAGRAVRAVCGPSNTGTMYMHGQAGGQMGAGLTYSSIKITEIAQ